MGQNKDVAVLAKKVYELSALVPESLELRKWEALLILGVVYASATPDGAARAHADRDARWGTKMQAEGLLSRMHPKWHLRVDDGKPPAVKLALESALDNPKRDLNARLAALQLVAPAERPPLDDLVRALAADAFAGATGEARTRYIDTMRTLSPTWFREPWRTALPHDGQPPPLSILIDHQGKTHDGGIYDDPSDDVDLLRWSHAVRTWDVAFLRDNPLAQLYVRVESAAATADELAGGVHEAAKGLARLLKWVPYVLAGIGTVGLTALVLTAATRRPVLLPEASR